MQKPSMEKLIGFKQSIADSGGPRVLLVRGVDAVKRHQPSTCPMALRVVTLLLAAVGLVIVVSTIVDVIKYCCYRRCGSDDVNCHTPASDDQADLEATGTDTA